MMPTMQAVAATKTVKNANRRIVCASRKSSISSRKRAFSDAIPNDGFAF
jgi:hypothetical protein